MCPILGRLALQSFVFDFCWGVLCLHGRASCSPWGQVVLSLWREGAALWSCVWASRCCGSSWGAGALGHVDFRGCWVWAQHSQWPGSRAQTQSPRHTGGVWALPGPEVKPMSPAWARDRLPQGHWGSPSPKLRTDLLTSPLFLREFLNNWAQKKDTTCTSFQWDP